MNNWIVKQIDLYRLRRKRGKQNTRQGRRAMERERAKILRKYKKEGCL